MAPLPTIIASGTSANEVLVDLFMERAIDLLRLEAGTRDKVLALLNDLEKELVAHIAAIDPTGPAQSRYHRARLVKLLQVVEASIQATYRLAGTLLADEIREIVDVEYTWTGEAINTATRATFVDSLITRNQLASLTTDILIRGAPSREMWGRQAAGVRNEFADQMRRGVLLGEPNAKLIERVRGSETLKGVLDLSRTSAERLVRASVQTAANAARDATYTDNSDLITALQWHATLDTRTSTWCIVRDGLRYTPVEHRPIEHKVPWLEGPGALHWGCRSSSVPILKSWRDLGIDEDEVEDTTRASMDGQVAAQTSFEAWLKQQSIERQNTVLGDGKADLWRRGKITFRDLLDQSGRPLTTEQLRAKASARQ